MRSLLNKIKRVSHEMRRLCGAPCADGIHAKRESLELHAETGKPVQLKPRGIEERSDYEIYTDESGYKWKPYSIEFYTCEGKFRVIMFAISDYHAAVMMADMTETACVDGQIVGVYQ